MKYSTFIIFTLIAVLITDAFRYMSWAGVAFDSSTVIAMILTYFSIAVFIYFTYKKGFLNNDIPFSIRSLFKIWFFWNVFNLIRGAALASDYWDWKFLFFSSIPFSLIPLVFFAGKSINTAHASFRFILKYVFPFGFLVIPLALTTNDELYSRLMIPVSLFILFIPFLKFKWKILIVAVAIVSVSLVVGFRANIVKIGFSILLLLLYYLRNYLGKNWLRLIHLFLFFIPVVFLALAIRGKYNILYETSKKQGYNIRNRFGMEENLVWDTRTFLYNEVLSTINETGDWLMGEGTSGKYKIHSFADISGVRSGYRYSTEVGILNILLYHGLIGVIIYFLLFFTVSYVAINRSANFLAKMLGLFIAFRWTSSFVEEYTQYDVNFFFLWLAIGLVSSLEFRKMKEVEIKKFFQAIR